VETGPVAAVATAEVLPAGDESDVSKAAEAEMSGGGRDDSEVASGSGCDGCGAVAVVVAVTAAVTVVV